ncbi:MAG: phospholipid carrier-dependent glycosyltransferase [Kofleriaceae bacterium]|nr:phospholipid carrier-dependent glycosyltransferase [Kofleriaceae bacterium]
MSRARALAGRYWPAIPIAIAIVLLVLRALLVTPPLDALARAPADPRDPPGTVAYEGSIEIARGGPVIIGFQSVGNARLVIDAHKELTGSGLVKDRIILPSGPVAIRFAAPPRARLVWSPVGRRGDPEYVSASSLSPEPPERASFDAPGTAILDGVIASLLLLLLVGSLLVLARRRLRVISRRTYLAMAAVFAGAVLARWIGLSAFGQTWDEDVNWAAGRNYITNLLSLDASAGSWQWNFEHPPVMKYLAGIGAQFADGFGPARALSAVWSALGCALLVPIGARLYNFRSGVLAGLIAALLPTLVAHGQIVGHESPTLLWWSLAILLALSVFDRDPGARRVRIRLAWVGVAIGIAVASRFVNGLVGPLALAIVVITAPAARRQRIALEAALIMPLAAIATVFAVWPRLWGHPIAALSESLAKLSKAHSPEPFLGVVTNQPGPHYFLVYLAATLPFGVLAGVVAYLARALRDRDRSAVIVALWFAIPLAVAFSPVRQDGVRYVMPCILALAIASAAGWDFLVVFFERRGIRRKFVGLAALMAVYLAITLARIHPYYLDYFGEQVGGPATVAEQRWFETAWWGEGLDRAVSYVNEHAASGDRVYRNCIEPVHLAWFREDLWTPMTNNPGEARWLVTYAPASRPCPIPRDARRVFSVSAQGATLAEVWKR